MDEQSNQLGNRSRLRSVFSRLFGIKPARAPRIEPREDGFEVFDLDQAKWRLRWDEVTAVVAFKLDRISTDTICFGFQRQGESDRLWCIEEDWDGFKAIEFGIEQLTHGGWPEKFAQVAKPAFEFNWTVIWEHPGTPPLGNDPLLIWFAVPDPTDPTH